MSTAYERLISNAEHVITGQDLQARIEGGKRLRVKLGVDPTAREITLGWAVPLRRLRRFQDEGHTAVLIMGDFTARIGDPSGKSETRPQLSLEQVSANAEACVDQLLDILSEDNLEVRCNSEWLESLDLGEVLKLTSSTTVAQMLEREDFSTRFKANRPISMIEFMYPLLQGYDSVAIEADVELGGTDQTFNLLMGREVQRAFGQPAQVVLTVPLLEGLDGVRKMSKSLDNWVGITEPADDQFGKLMSIPDELIVKYLRLCAPLDPTEVDEVEQGLADGSLHPNDQKRRMARLIVDLYHGESAGERAEATFDRVHKRHEVPLDVPEVAIDPGWAGEDGLIWLPRLLVGTGLAGTNGEARRAVRAGGVRLDGASLDDPDAELDAGSLRGKVLAFGRRRFVRLV